MGVQTESTALWRRLPIGGIIGLSVLLVLGVLAGWVISIVGDRLDFRAFFVLAIAVPLFFAFVAGKRLWEAMIYFWILTFGLGYRTVHITGDLSLHPSELIMWLMFLSLLGYVMWQHKSGQPFMPRWAWLFAFFWPLGFVRAFQNGVNWDLQLAAFLPIAVALPIFAFTRQVLDSENKFRNVGALLAIVAFYISFLGVLEYFVPSAVAPFHGFFSEAIESTSEEGFVRAGFSFWGSPVVSNVLVLVLPMILVQLHWWKRIEARLFLLATVALTLLAIYISGYRSIWFLSVVEMFLYFLLRRSGKLVGLLTGGLVVVGLAAPVVAQVRVMALLTEGFMSDSSALKRLYRIQKTLVVFRQSPLDGWGWGSTGWVHSDLLQIAAMLGIFAFLAFIGWYLYTLMRVVRLYRTSKEPWVWEESVAFITFLVGFIVVLSIQAAIVLPQLIIPMWLLFAMAEQLPRLAKSPPGDTAQPALANPGG